MKGFRGWWDSLAAELESSADIYHAARRIDSALGALTPRRRKAYVDPLLESLVDLREFGVALFVMESLDDPDSLKRLAESLLELPATMEPDREGHLADLIRILAVSSQASAMEVARGYLLERTITSAWETVPWALWPDHRFMFLEAWARFFLETPPIRWKDGDVVRSFLAEPEAIEALRARLRPAHSRRWQVLRRSLLRQMKQVRWLTAEETRQIEEMLR